MSGLTRPWEARFGRSFRTLCIICGWLLAGGRVGAGTTNASPAGMKIDLADPPIVTGTFYEIGSNRKTVLFKYRRVATRDEDVIQVEQTFTIPDGSVACRENIRYQNGELVSYAMQDLRAGSRGSVVVEPDPKKPKKERLQLVYAEDGGKIQKASETAQPNTLISDTIYPYILGHWDELLAGGAVKFRFISLDPPATFSFRLTKDSEGTWQGRPFVGIKMEPTNFIVAHWIRPIFFTIEQAAPHRVFSYTGRTTPRILTGGAWKFADAEAVFDWP